MASGRRGPRCSCSLALCCSIALVLGNAHGLLGLISCRAPAVAPRPPFRAPARRTALHVLKCSAAGAQGRAEDAIERLNAWLRTKEVFPEEGCVEVARVDYGLGLCAVRELDANAVAVDVPQHAVISEAAWSEGMDEAAAGRVQAMLYDAWGWGGGGGGLEVGDILLAVRLLHEKALGEDSAWAPYIAALPSDLSDSPLQWSSEEVQTLLRGLLMADDASALRRAIDSSFSLLDSTCFQVLRQQIPPPVLRLSRLTPAVAHICGCSACACCLPFSRRRCLPRFRRTSSPSPPGAGPWARRSAAAFLHLASPVSAPRVQCAQIPATLRMTWPVSCACAYSTAPKRMTA